MKRLLTQHPRETLFLAVATAVYAALRLTGLTALPIFSDEAIYIHWAQIISRDPSQFLISFTDGKQPLFMWLNTLTVDWFADPLVSGRVVSVIAGWFSMFGLYRIGRMLWDAKVGAAAAMLYVLCPYTFFFDRLALVDGLMTALGIWSMFWAFRIIREEGEDKPNFRNLGIALGLSVLTKATALLLFPVIGLMFLLNKVQKRSDFWVHSGIALGIAVVMNAAVHFASPTVSVPGRVPFLHHPAFFIGPSELWTFPWLLWLRNLVVAMEFMETYLTGQLILVLMAGVVILFLKKDLRELSVWCWFFFPTLIIILIAQGFFSRYFLIAIPAALLIAAATLERLVELSAVWIKKTMKGTMEVHGRARWGVWGFLMALVLYPGVSLNIDLIRNPLTAELHPLDRMLYVEGMNSGYGIREAAEFLDRESQTVTEKLGHKMYVLVPHLPGNPAEGITVYLFGNPRINIVPAFWWPERTNLIPTRVRFTLRPSIYQMLPRLRRESHLLDFAYFIYPYSVYPQEMFLKHNPTFHKVWSHAKPDSRFAVDIFRNKTVKKTAP